MDAKRKKLVALMEQTVANERGWHYLFARPLTLPTLTQAKTGTVKADCSFGVKNLCFLANVPDPTGFGYGSGYGNSTSIYQHLPHVTYAQAEVGDIGVFGVEGNQHAMQLYKKAPKIADSLWWSFGGEYGPGFYTYDVERRYHSGQPFTICRVLPPPPKPAQGPDWYKVALKQKPLWAWINWRDHKRPKQWRPPQVPRLVPPWWWARLRLHQRGGDQN